MAPPCHRGHRTSVQRGLAALNASGPEVQASLDVVAGGGEQSLALRHLDQKPISTTSGTGSEIYHGSPLHLRGDGLPCSAGRNCSHGDGCGLP